MSEYIVELDSKHSIALRLAFFEEMRGGDFVRGEIVRCRDCKHGHEAVWPVSWAVPDDYLDCAGELVTTWDYYRDEPQSNPVPSDGFCAWGGEEGWWRMSGQGTFDKLNEALFVQLDKMQEADASDAEAFDRVLEQTKAVSQLAGNIVDNASTAIRAMQFYDRVGMSAAEMIGRAPKMLGGGE